MQLPVAPLALFLALIPTLVLLALAWWRGRSGSLTAFHAAAFALGLGLAAVVLAVSLTYAFPLVRPLQASKALLAIPSLVYVLTIVTAGKKFKLPYGSLGVWSAVGLVPLWFLGFYAWILAACSFGDCL